MSHPPPGNDTNKHFKYRAEIKQDGKIHNLGAYTGPAEAALAYARYLGPAACAAANAPPAATEEPMTEEEALRLAAREGVALMRSNNATGYTGVSHCRRNESHLFKAQIMQAGREHYLGRSVLCAPTPTPARV